MSRGSVRPISLRDLEPTLVHMRSSAVHIKPSLLIGSFPSVLDSSSSSSSSIIYSQQSFMIITGRRMSGCCTCYKNK